ncbi:hypothetical protein [Salinibacterium sp.]|uniref:hypothetical protein n=1 Tax=Salinibacterium sp. TaxID=1915057 RepID=UPI00286A7C20|nr:hypothetical protein [Salinibacterium sp.]
MRSDDDGITLFETFHDFGLDPARLPGAFRRPEEPTGYLEGQRESGQILEGAGRELAVVTSITAARRFELSMIGRAGHAGSTSARCHGQRERVDRRDRAAIA